MLLLARQQSLVDKQQWTNICFDAELFIYLSDHAIMQGLHLVDLTSWQTVEVISGIESYCQDLTLIHDDCSTGDFVDC